MIEKFEELLMSTNREGMESLLDYIRNTDFYTAPASTRFHGSHEGGLLEHSLNVYECLKNKRDSAIWKDVLKDVPDESLILVALLHDLCKANTYKVDYRNAKNAQGVWEKVPYYALDDQLPYGHGEKSVMLIEEHVHLTMEERFAIRWHMAFSEPKENWGSLGSAIAKYPLILATNQADLEATYLIEGNKK